MHRAGGGLPRGRLSMSAPPRPHRTVVICQDDELLNREALPRWLASFTDLAAVVAIHEPGSRRWKRVKREIKRVGWFRFLDVLALRLYSRLFLSARDRAWEQETLRRLESLYPPVAPPTRILATASPNSAETERLLRELEPDLIVARCKTLLAERIFRRASRGVFVMHPGICPEYRNAHGCFWALAGRDKDNVGMTLLRIDAGVDTGPVYGYFRCEFDEAAESHNIIQNRVVFDNLPAIERRLREILEGTAAPLDTTGRKSQAWGQPWLSAYLRWKKAARREKGKSCGRSHCSTTM
jgi:folate-dependent phosphoribosylglycinamide formyltransferase PurN